MPDIEKVRQIHKKVANNWLTLEDVVAVGIGLNREGNPCLIVSLRHENKRTEAMIPSQIEDIPVEIRISGPVKAL